MIPEDPVCIKCGSMLSDFTGEDKNSLPEEGDISICLYCGNVSIYMGGGLDLRPPSAEEMEEIEDLPKFQRAQTIVKLWQHLKNNPRT
jgi:hypothetical protein